MGFFREYPIWGTYMCLGILQIYEEPLFFITMILSILIPLESALHAFSLMVRMLASILPTFFAQRQHGPSIQEERVMEYQDQRW